MTPLPSDLNISVTASLPPSLYQSPAGAKLLQDLREACTKLEQAGGVVDMSKGLKGFEEAVLKLKVLQETQQTTVSTVSTLPESISHVLCYGGGVIGAGWASRFALNGARVTVVDPDPECARKVEAVLENAKWAWRKLLSEGNGSSGTSGLSENLINQAHVLKDSQTSNPNPTFAPGSIRILSPLSPEHADAFHAALRRAEFIQESLPEVPKIKTEAYGLMEKYVTEGLADTSTDSSKKLPPVLASSTSGILPKTLQEKLSPTGPCYHNLVIAHPFNPVYLLPLVEVAANEEEEDVQKLEKVQNAKQSAKQVYESMGMKVLMLGGKAGRTPGFVADRLLEAIWREGLWMVKEGK